MEKISTAIFNVGFFLFTFIWAVISVSTALLLIGVPIGAANTILAFFLSTAILFVFIRDMRSVLAVLLFSLLLMALSALIIGSIYDYSWDGNAYHKMAVGLLRSGWNPIWQKFQEASDLLRLFPGVTWEPWTNAYPKASWIFAASIYALTGNIEAGKCYTLIAAIGLLFITLTMVTNTKKIGWVSALACLVLFVFNPITISQIDTYYNDAFLGLMLFAMIASFTYVSLFPNGALNRMSLFLGFISIGIGLNLKFSGLIHIGIFSVAFLIYWIIKRVRIKDTAQKQGYIPRMFLYFATAYLTAILFLGSTSYISNTRTYHNPVYPIFGTNNIEIIGSQNSKDYTQLSAWERFFYSLTSQTNNTLDEGILHPKIPFSVTRSEIITCFYGYDIRTAGWGPLFSGILIISVFLVSFTTFILRRKKEKGGGVILLLLISIVLPIFFVPGLFWARYFPQLYIIPLIAGLIGFSNFYCEKRITQSITYSASIVIIIASLINASFFLFGKALNINRSTDARLELAGLRELAGSNPVEVSVSSYDLFGLEFNVRDMGIKTIHTSKKIDAPDMRIEFLYLPLDCRVLNLNNRH